MGNISALLHHPLRSPHRYLGAAALSVVALTSALCLYLSPHEYPEAHRSPRCVAPLASLFHKQGFTSLVITNCLLSEDPARMISGWYYKKSPRLTPVDLPGYPFWHLGPLTVMVYQEVELPSPEILGGRRETGQTAVISRTYYGLGWRH